MIEQSILWRLWRTSLWTKVSFLHLRPSRKGGQENAFNPQRRAVPSESLLPAALHICKRCLGPLPPVSASSLRYSLCSSWLSTTTRRYSGCWRVTVALYLALHSPNPASVAVLPMRRRPGGLPDPCSDYTCGNGPRLLQTLRHYRTHHLGPATPFSTQVHFCALGSQGWRTPHIVHIPLSPTQLHPLAPGAIRACGRICRVGGNVQGSERS